MSILTAPNYQQCQEFIEKIKEKRFNKVKERQVRKLNNLIKKKEGGITWHSSQVFPATRAFPQVNNRQVTPATRALQAGRLTSSASNQASQGDSALSPSTISQAGNPKLPWQTALFLWKRVQSLRQAIPSLLRQAVPSPPQKTVLFPRVISPRQAVPRLTQ